MSNPSPFNVISGAPITVEFINNTDSTAVPYSYSVFDNAYANETRLYSSLPFYSAIENPCPNVTC